MAWSYTGRWLGRQKSTFAERAAGDAAGTCNDLIWHAYPPLLVGTTVEDLSRATTGTSVFERLMLRVASCPGTPARFAQICDPGQHAAHRREVPDSVSMAATAIAIGAGGALNSIHTTVLLLPSKRQSTPWGRLRRSSLIGRSVVEPLAKSVSSGKRDYLAPSSKIRV